MSTTALLLVDFQNDYFPSVDGALWPLEGADAAAVQGAKLLAAFREKNLPVIHVRHENLVEEAPFFKPNSEGAQINVALAPVDGEPVIVKRHANSFKETELQETLSKLGIEKLVIAGAMSNMCIDAVTRAAADSGYACAVAHDACAAMRIEFNGVTVSAAVVHAAFMGALALGYAELAATEQLLGDI